MSKELDFAKTIAKDAGSMMLKTFRSRRKIDWKQDHSPITETDIAINTYIIEQVKEKYPKHGLLGEEESYEPERNLVWVLDPIDGTIPFTAGIPTSTFSLALVENGDPILGVLYDPYMDRLLFAEQGGGTFLNNEKISVSAQSTVDKSYIMVSSRMGYQASDTKTRGQVSDELHEMGAKIFNFACFTYGATYVANGGLEAAMIATGEVWDVAAAKIIIEEAGGKATDIFGNPRKYSKGSIGGQLVSNGLLHDDLLKLINS